MTSSMTSPRTAAAACDGGDEVEADAWRRRLPAATAAAADDDETVHRTRKNRTPSRLHVNRQDKSRAMLLALL